MKPVSIVIPCYNSEAYVKRAVESALAQTYPIAEIILVDNDSRDSTLKVLHEFATRFPEKVKVLQEKKRGVSAARNRGLHGAKGEWVQFLDSDNELLPDKIKNQMLVADSSGAGVIIGDRYKCKDGEDYFTGRLVRAETENYLKAVINSRLNSVSPNLWKRTALLQVQGWNEDWVTSEDYELLFRMLMCGVKFSHVPIADTVVYTRNESLSRTADVDRACAVVDTSVRLRLEIKKSLREQGRLTADLSRTIDLYIYRRTMSLQRIAPDYLKQKLAVMALNLPFQIQFELAIRKAFGKFKNKLGGKVD